MARSKHGRAARNNSHASLVRPARRLQRHTQERIGIGQRNRKHITSGCWADRHGHWRPVWNNNPDGQQSSTITLSANATVSGSESLSASTPADVVPFQGDFDGDGLTDLAYYDLGNATWYTDDSLRGTSSFVLGIANSSLPVVGYFDVNGPEEMGVFTIINGKGVWSIASASTSTVTFGQTGDIPAPGNYDGLGYDEIAVYRPSTGQFLVLEPNGTTETLNLGVGNSADLSSLVPVPGAYDNLAYFTGSPDGRNRSGPKRLCTILSPACLQF